MLIPLAGRQASDGLLTQDMLFCRSDHTPTLKRLWDVVGVSFLMGEHRQLMVIENEFVQDLIQKTKQAFLKQSAGIGVGSFVRIADGTCRDYCGTVTNIEGNRASVEITLKSKMAIVDTPVHNLICIDVPVEKRVFYYCDAVKELSESEVPVLGDDLRYVEDTRVSKEPEVFPKFSRPHMISYRARQLVAEGVTEPRELVARLLPEIADGKIKRPKSWACVYQILRPIITEHFRETDPRITDYYDIRRKHGDAYTFSPQSLSDLDPSIPVAGKADPNDGRVRRWKAKQSKSEEPKEPVLDSMPLPEPNSWLVAQFLARDSMMSAKELAKIVGVTQTQISYAAGRGEIPYIRLGGIRLYDPVQMAAWAVKQQKV